MRISRGPLLIPRLLLPRKGERLSSFLAANVPRSYGLYSSGRTALLHGLRLLGCGPEDNALLPAYICDSALEPFHALGAQVRFYQVHPDLGPDIADLERQIDGGTKAVLAVDYFGFPLPFEQMQAMCRKHRLPLIEDNAHSFLSRLDTRLLGTLGDIGIASLRKTMPVPNGGVLYVATRTPRDPQPAPAANAGLMRDGAYCLEGLLSYLEARVRFPKSRLGELYRRWRLNSEHPNGSQTVEPLNPYLSLHGPAAITLGILARLDFDHIVARRRQNYRLWAEALSAARGLRLVYPSLPDGVCPQVCPVMAEEPGSFAEAMRHMSVAVHRWPYLPREVEGNPEYPAANYLAQHLFALPVHQDVDQEYLLRVCQRLNARPLYAPARAGNHAT